MSGKEGKASRFAEVKRLQEGAEGVTTGQVFGLTGDPTNTFICFIRINGVPFP